MSRSGYHDDLDEADFNLWTGTVTRALRGKRGQALLVALRDALDAMPSKRLVAGELEADGEVCALGAVARHRGLDVSGLDPYEREAIAEAFDIAPALAAEVMYVNDDDVYPMTVNETPEARWVRVRAWVERRIAAPGKVVHR
jgi:hypothetical protein